MKNLTEGAHLISDNLIVAKATNFWHASFWRANVQSDM